MSDFKIDAVEILEPQSLSIQEFNIEKEQRLASARLVKSVIAVKNIFTLYYPFIKWSDLSPIVDALTVTGGFFTFQYLDKGAVQTATVTVSEIPRELTQKTAVAADWVFSGIRLIFKEQ